MVPGLIQYLEEMSRHLRLNPVKQRQVLREMYTHLEERVRELQAEGHSLSDAVRRATESFGRPQTVARDLCAVHNTGAWTDAALAASPYILIAFLFGLHLWQSLAWLIVFGSTSVIMSLIGWWRGKPLWLFPWAGFALVLPLVSAVIAGSAALENGANFFRGRDFTLPFWVLLGLMTYIPLAGWLVISVLIRVVLRDWIYASLMLLPFPILVRWLLSLQVEGGTLVYSRPFLNVEADAAIAVVFLLLAHLPVLFVRGRDRRWKIAALLLATPPAFIIAAYNTPGSTNVLALLALAVVAVLFLLAPALLGLALDHTDRRSGVIAWAEPGSRDGRAR